MSEAKREERDPRRDPRPGDVLRGWWTREVMACAPLMFRDEREWVRYRQRGTSGDIIGDRSCLLVSWRRWAKSAEVVKIGGEG